MKKLMNKKGFTLVELLAVIVILAVIILVAMNAVIPQMEKARKNAFITEAERYLQAAKTYYTTESMKGAVTDTCVNITELTDTYVEKSNAKDKDGNVIYTGKVEYEADGTDFTIWISNKEFIISEKTLQQLSTDGEANVAAYETDAPTCGEGE